MTPEVFTAVKLRMSLLLDVTLRPYVDGLKVRKRCFFEISGSMYPGSSVITQNIGVPIPVYFSMTDPISIYYVHEFFVLLEQHFIINHFICANSTLAKQIPLMKDENFP